MTVRELKKNFDLKSWDWADLDTLSLFDDVEIDGGVMLHTEVKREDDVVSIILYANGIIVADYHYVLLGADTEKIKSNTSDLVHRSVKVLERFMEEVRKYKFEKIWQTCHIQDAAI